MSSKKTTAQRADAKTQPRGDLQLRCICSNSTSSEKTTAQRADAKALSRKATPTYAASAATHTSSKENRSENPPDVNAQPRCNTRIRCVPQRLNVF